MYLGTFHHWLSISVLHLPSQDHRSPSRGGTRRPGFVYGDIMMSKQDSSKLLIQSWKHFMEQGLTPPTKKPDLKLQASVSVCVKCTKDHLKQPTPLKKNKSQPVTISKSRLSRLLRLPPESSFHAQPASRT